MGLWPATAALTAVLTVAAMLVSSSELGAGFLLVLAALGGDAIWWLPLHLAFVLPAALSGGILLAASGSRSASDRPEPVQVATATLVVTLLSLWLVGWALPQGNRIMSASMARFNEKAVEAPKESPARFDLPRLMADRSPEARVELTERIRLVGRCLVLGLVATLLVASPLSWRPSLALIAALAVFIFQMRHLLERHAQ